MTSLSGPLKLAQAMETALDYMLDPLNAPWVEIDKVGAERQLKNQLAASLQWGFAIDDPYHPELRYFDQESQFGLFNPDNRYYMGSIAADGEYVIKGTIGTVADINIQVGGGHPGFDPHQINLDPISLFTKDNITTNADGEFEIHISDAQQAGQVNWMVNSKPCSNDDDNETTSCGSKATSIFIRETFMDWESERAGTWYLERTDAQGLPSPIVTQASLDEQYDRAASYLVNGTIGWVDLVANKTRGGERAVSTPSLRRRRRAQSSDGTPSPPTLTKPEAGDDGFVGQFNSFGIFSLLKNPTLAYIISVKQHPNATYQGVQIGDLWFNSLDYCRRQTSLNIHQAVESSDGMHHFVISNRDPGVANWLDPSGTKVVTTYLRWQGVQGAGSAELAPPFVPTVKVVPFADIPQHFPSDEPVFTEDQRKEQLAARQAACLNNPRGF